MAEPPAADLAIPAPVLDLLQTLWRAGHAGYAVGGSLRDAFLGRPPRDWDLATDAHPERVVELLPEAVYENRFGTVAVRHHGELYEITTFRSDHDYADFRRPHRVEWTDRLELDLGRRDFTVNAMAWGAGRRGASDEPTPEAPALVDPFDGRADVRAHRLRAVGDPAARFGEDALRMIRAVRLAAELEFTIEPATLAAIEARSELAARLSGERIAAELDRLLAAPVPSVGLRLLESTGLLQAISPELAAQRGIEQDKIPGDDLWDHTVRSVDAAPASNPIVRLAALLHDIGKPATAADGHFYGHDKVGAELARDLLERLHYPRSVIERVGLLVRYHMPTYQPEWGDAAIRRFIRKVGRHGLEELWALTEADNIGSGEPRDAGGLAELRRRVDEQLAAEVALDLGDLAVDGDDLMTELDLVSGPTVGRLLDGLLERVMDDPTLNDRPTLLLLARTMLEEAP
jgi:poly(A) polymerase/tRNA nucleotidyltransferase (CCA-adding enzyme)